MLNSLKDVEFIENEKILGTGAYSSVVKVKSRVDGNYYALKKVR